MNEFLKPYFTIDAEDKKVWLGVLGAGLIGIILLSVFTTTSFFYYLERYVVALMMIFLPGYLVMKIYFDKLSLSDSRVTDKVMMAFGLSVLTMVVPYYLSTYLRPASFNTDEDKMQAISDTTVVVVLLLLVIGISFGLKYYQNRNNQSQS
ncbi:MAG: hypothetical protein FIA97_10390 [Methylococcaceae bacterium]|nr:hypothetical protein [Methylococcaceae bacterium]